MAVFDSLKASVEHGIAKVAGKVSKRAGQAFEAMGWTENAEAPQESAPETTGTAAKAKPTPPPPPRKAATTGRRVVAAAASPKLVRAPAAQPKVKRGQKHRHHR